jgi:hypothetical protein
MNILHVWKLEVKNEELTAEKAKTQQNTTEDSGMRFLLSIYLVSEIRF